MAKMNKEAIIKDLKKILGDTFDVEKTTIRPETRLIEDLGAESIDFLDLTFRLEKKFGIETKRGEIWTEYGRPPLTTSFMSVYSEDGRKEERLTSQGIKKLKTKYAHINWTGIEEKPEVMRLREFVTVGSLVNYLEKKLGEN